MSEGLIVAIVIYGIWAMIQYITFMVHFFSSENSHKHCPAYYNTTHHNFSKAFWAFVWCVCWGIIAPFSNIAAICQFGKDGRD